MTHRASRRVLFDLDSRTVIVEPKDFIPDEYLDGQVQGDTEFFAPLLPLIGSLASSVLPKVANIASGTLSKVLTAAAPTLKNAAESVGLGAVNSLIDKVTSMVTGGDESDEPSGAEAEEEQDAAVRNNDLTHHHTEYFIEGLMTALPTVVGIVSQFANMFKKQKRQKQLPVTPPGGRPVGGLPLDDPDFIAQLKAAFSVPQRVQLRKATPVVKLAPVEEGGDDEYAFDVFEDCHQVPELSEALANAGVDPVSLVTLLNHPGIINDLNDLAPGLGSSMARGAIYASNRGDKIAIHIPGSGALSDDEFVSTMKQALDDDRTLFFVRKLGKRFKKAFKPIGRIAGSFIRSMPIVGSAFGGGRRRRGAPAPAFGGDSGSAPLGQGGNYQFGVPGGGFINPHEQFSTGMSQLNSFGAALSGQAQQAQVPQSGPLVYQPQPQQYIPPSSIMPWPQQPLPREYNTFDPTYVPAPANSDEPSSPFGDEPLGETFRDGLS